MNKVFPIFALLVLVCTSLTSAAAFDTQNSPQAQEPIGIDCTSNGVGYPLGTTLTLMCPSCERHAFYGDGTYSDDSSVCSSAAHMGVIDLAQGGTVTILITAGLPQWPSATRNGLTSNESVGGPVGFQVVGGSAPISSASGSDTTTAATGGTEAQGTTPDDPANKEALCQIIGLQQTMLRDEAIRLNTALDAQTQLVNQAEVEFSASLDRYVQCQGTCETELLTLAKSIAAKSYVQSQANVLRSLVANNTDAQNSYQQLSSALSCAAA